MHNCQALTIVRFLPGVGSNHLQTQHIMLLLYIDNWIMKLNILCVIPNLAFWSLLRSQATFAENQQILCVKLLINTICSLKTTVIMPNTFAITFIGCFTTCFTTGYIHCQMLACCSSVAVVYRYKQVYCNLSIIRGTFNSRFIT